MTESVRHPAKLENEDDSSSPALEPPPPRSKEPLGRLLVVLPLVGLAAAIAWLWRDAPHSRQLLLRFGNAASQLERVELVCQDEHGLESGARWAFTHDAPRELSHTTSATGEELECTIVLETPRQRSEVVRRLRFESDSALLWLEAEVH